MEKKPKPRRTNAIAPSSARASASPLYGVAMLKIAMELKKQNGRDVDEILRGVLTRMGLSEEAFRSFLEENGGLLKAIAQKKGF